MANGGFNPFRDTHGRFADQPGLGGGSRETLSAPLPSKTEWSKDGVSVEFTGGRTPTYEVRHAGQVIATVQATAKWRQDLMTAQLKAEEHLVKLQTEQANQMVRAQVGLGAATPPPGPEAIREAAAAARKGHTVEGYVAAGQQVMAAVDADPEVASLRGKVAQLEAQMQATPVQHWPVQLSRDAVNARWNLGAKIRDKALELVEQTRPMARREDLNIDAQSLERGIDYADELIGFWPKSWVAASSRFPLFVEKTESSRSYYSNHEECIYLSDGARRSTMAHEMGHWIEWRVPRLREAAQAYLAHRTRGEDLVQLREVSNRNYGADEWTRPDRFEHPYFGKHYDSGSTELVSMMSEEMTDGTRGVTLKDPDLFAWFCGVMVSV